MTIKWGDPIECNGVRPDWLRVDEPCTVQWAANSFRDGEWSALDGGEYTAGDFWGSGDVKAFRLPADHPAYVALARGFTPWSGGDSAPDDWDGGPVLLNSGDECEGSGVTSWAGQIYDFGVIGYRKRVEYGAVHTDGSRSGGQPPIRFVNPPNLTEAEVRALVGGYDAAHRMVEALRERGQLRPETTAERFTRETGHAVTEAVEAALNWKES